MAGVADSVRRPSDGLVVLIYHRVGAITGVPVDLPTPMFEEQMALLASTDSSISLGDAVERLRLGEDLTGRVAVTFDDGTADFVDTAAPILHRHGIPATLYVATSFIEDQQDFPDCGRPLTWAGLSEVMSTGLITVGSHTHSHSLLDRLPPQEIDDELDRSIHLIGERLGVRAEHFAYPKALAPSREADRAVRSRFTSAALAGTRANPVDTDVFMLRRSPVQVADGMHWFARKLAGGMSLEDDLRGVVNKRRYREVVA